MTTTLHHAIKVAASRRHVFKALADAGEMAAWHVGGIEGKIAVGSTIYLNPKPGPSNGPDAFFVAQFSAGYTTNMFGFDLRQGQP